MNEIIQEINKTIESLGYPSDFECLYDQIECLKSSSGRETFLIKNKENDNLYIAKCYDKKVHILIPEITMLMKLEYDGIPKYIGNYENDDYVIIVREYIEGISLDKYLKDNQLLDSEKLSICDKLADILIYLHNQEKPVIHRDIKPKNIIVKNNGDICLIDFDIARTFKNEKETDTVFFGTKVYAPPEQYGFEQTDQRSDIYAFGVLMHFMFYGDPKKEEITIDKHIKTVIDKCTSFSPTDRYSNMREVKKSLKVNNSKTMIFIIAVLMIISCLLFTIISNNHEPSKVTADIKEKTIAEAIRLQLDLKENQQIYEEDLLNIEDIFIFGTGAYNEMTDTFMLNPSNTIVGTVDTLDDFKYLPNVKTVFVNRQLELDISGLINCININRLELKHTRLSDLSPLCELENLNSLNLFDSRVTDVTILNSLKKLELLDVGLNNINNMQQIGVFENLKELSLKMLKMNNLDGIELMPTIEIVWINGSQFDDISALAELPNLKAVHTDANYIDAVNKLLEGRNIEITCEEN